MSRGFGAFAQIFAFDEETVIYEYGSYNLNDEHFRNANHICDGYITIQRKCFVEPEIHEKVKKMPSGRKKLVIKRIPVNVEFKKLIDAGSIEVINCSNCWETLGERNIDRMVMLLLDKIFREYQINGEIPDLIPYDV